MNLELEGKTAIVTGASRGIGRAIAERLSAEGVGLTLVARSRDALEALAESLPTDTLVCAGDLRDAAFPASLVAATLAKFGGIDMLVNNAGATKRGDFLTFTDDDWHDGFALKFYGAMRCARAAWPHLVASNGSIVSIVGIGGRTPGADFSIGGAVNAALLNLTKSLAARGTRDGVRVNAINPGSIATDRLTTRIEHFAAERHLDVESARRELAASMGVSRFGEPREIADAVAFLLAPRSGYIHGAIVDADGGQTGTL